MNNSKGVIKEKIKDKANKAKESKGVRKFAEFCIRALIYLNLCAAILITEKSIEAKYGDFFNNFFYASICIFCIEILLRIFLPNTGEPVKGFFFKKGNAGEQKLNYWNIFDLIITAFSSIAIIPGFHGLIGARALRVARVASSARMMSAHKSVKDMTEALVKAVPRMFTMFRYFALLYIIYAIIGIDLYGKEFPFYFGGINRAFLTLFQIMTFDNWTIIMHKIMKVHPYAWIFFISFIIIASYILLNLLVGIIVESLHQVRRKRELQEEDTDLEKELRKLREQIRKVNYLLDKRGGK